MTRWWRRPWIVPLAALVVIFMVFSLPPYLSFDPARSRVPQPPSLGVAHFWLLVPHVLFGGVALATAVLQIWPWLRQRHPVAHRRIGRVYVFGGVLPAGLCALTIGAFTPYGPATRASDVLLGLLWLAVTAAGWRAARRRRFAEHRRWMIRSFALTASIITNRIWAAIFVITLSPQLETTFHGDEGLLSWVASAAAAWLGWTVPLLIAEFWLERERHRGRPAAGRPATPQAAAPQPAVPAP
ncbi:DUF2306 domain-containing protein [Actinoplanes teichomyceticus]|uniref:Putative membrane protein DUF2306 n=1 Tax=Actinoplanes teichomyceticus TaxID=1867 RepID=A0A561WIY2_ACTTI|nr:DUF2306 domain-containing protein [Actinoplanes teichomyceticus]TWG23825.1 putative membrane protein DUF2306 [Actinoplanes teichomyceticus]